MLTWGGAMSGYCATGSVKIAPMPAEHDDDRDHPGEDRAIDEDPRHAPSAPRLALASPSWLARRRRLDASAARSAGTGLTGAPSLQVRSALRDHLFAGCEALRSTTQSGPACARRRPCAATALLPGPTTNSVALPLRIARDRLLRHQEGRRVDRLRECGASRTCREAGRLRVGEARAQRDRAGALVDQHLG